jgi:hypothetical protein
VDHKRPFKRVLWRLVYCTSKTYGVMKGTGEIIVFRTRKLKIYLASFFAKDRLGTTQLHVHLHLMKKNDMRRVKLTESLTFFISMPSSC